MESGGIRRDRHCVSCGRPIPFDAQVCPYCRHDYRAIGMFRDMPETRRIGGGTRAALYILSFLIFIAGIILGVVYLTKGDDESKDVGKMCLILAIIGMVIAPVFLAAVLYLMVLG